jgi:hypothetical protein
MSRHQHLPAGTKPDKWSYLAAFGEAANSISANFYEGYGMTNLAYELYNSIQGTTYDPGDLASWIGGVLALLSIGVAHAHLRKNTYLQESHQHLHTATHHTCHHDNHAHLEEHAEHKDAAQTSENDAHEHRAVKIAVPATEKTALIAEPLTKFDRFSVFAERVTHTFDVTGACQVLLDTVLKAKNVDLPLWARISISGGFHIFGFLSSKGEARSCKHATMAQNVLEKNNSM